MSERQARSLRNLVNREGRPFLINWGSSSLPAWAANFQALNNPQSVRIAISKVQTYERLTQASVPTLEFTRDRRQAGRWQARGRTILQRRDGLSGGRGIVLHNASGTSLGDLADEVRSEGEEPSSFYTRYFPKTHEYRVHVGPAPRTATESTSGELFESGARATLFESCVIDLVQKKRSNQSIQDVRGMAERIVRSHDNGWIFAHENLFLEGGIRELISSTAVSAVQALGLDFGAVDIAVRAQPGQRPIVKVLEVNTAPGLENTQTIQAYINSFRSVIR